MNLEDIGTKTNVVQLHLHEVTPVVKFIENESRVVVAGGWGDVSAGI